jgi:NAD(P)-dependent dehydrogenase (short-subunit alcohol dehydrogenase family)
MLLAKEGASAVMIGDLDMEAAGEVVTKEQSVRGIFERMMDVFGRVDYCVNCAGVSAAMGR